MVTTPVGDPARSAAAAAALAVWRREVLTGLAGPRGWWSVVALSWAGTAPACWGSGSDAGLPLPARCPERVAWVWRDGLALHVRPVAGTRLTLDGVPVAGEACAPEGSVLRVGDEPDAVEAVVLRRCERIGMRTFDPRQGAARDRDDLAWYRPLPGWVVPADLQPAPAGASLQIVNLLGDVVEVPLAGRLAFELAAARHELLATPGHDGLFVHFRDATSGRTTYGAGRFLRVAAPDQTGRTWLDFHRAVQPPCHHTPHATCPMPPLGNRLPVAVRAGERMRRRDAPTLPGAA